jgi:hypothetical protein
MHIDEVHRVIKRAMATTTKVAQAGIEYYQQRIKELEALVLAATKAAADDTLPRSTADAEIQRTLSEAMEKEIGSNVSVQQSPDLSRAMRRAAKEGGEA